MTLLILQRVVLSWRRTQPMQAPAESTNPVTDVWKHILYNDLHTMTTMVLLLTKLHCYVVYWSSIGFFKVSYIIIVALRK